MKDIKSYVIGFLSCACLFLIMGQTKAKPMDDIKTMLTQNGRYQAFGDSNHNEYMIDTRTGEKYYWDSGNTNKKTYKPRRWIAECSNPSNCFKDE